MPRRPAVLLTPPRPISPSSLACPACPEPRRELRRVHSPYTPFEYKNEAHPLSSQLFARSYTKTPGCQGLYLQTLSGKMCHPKRFSIPTDFADFTDHGTRPTDHAPITPLGATLTADLRVLPCFGRNRPSITPLDATLTDFASVTPLGATLTKNRGDGGAAYLIFTNSTSFASPVLPSSSILESPVPASYSTPHFLASHLSPGIQCPRFRRRLSIVGGCDG
jgi:hypothetical protein